jgi:hypothetical protein
MEPGVMEEGGGTEGEGGDDMAVGGKARGLVRERPDAAGSKKMHLGVPTQPRKGAEGGRNVEDPLPAWRFGRPLGQPRVKGGEEPAHVARRAVAPHHVVEGAAPFVRAEPSGDLTHIRGRGVLVKEDREAAADIVERLRASVGRPPRGRGVEVVNLRLGSEGKR